MQRDPARLADRARGAFYGLLCGDGASIATNTLFTAAPGFTAHLPQSS